MIPKYRYENVKCIDVYDGDTITVIIDFGFKLTQEVKIRLARIDAPELRGSTKEAGKKSRDILREMILNESIVLSTQKKQKGKYGRIVAEVYYQGSNLNNWLVRQEYAKYREY